VHGKKYLLMDRDAKLSETFRVTLEQARVDAVHLPPRSLNLNPNIERFMRSVEEECLHRMTFFGERSLQVAAAEFLSHFHTERNHQGLGSRLIEPGVEVGRTAGDVACRERLGGPLRYYRKAAPPAAWDVSLGAVPHRGLSAGDGSRLYQQAEKRKSCPAAEQAWVCARLLSAEIAARCQLRLTTCSALAGRPRIFTIGPWN